MKTRYIYIIMLIATSAFSQNVNAQIPLPIIDPEIYVSPYGFSGDYDYGVGGFTNAISPSRLMTVLTDNTPVYGGDVTIYFAGGDYYTNFEFYNLANSISHLEIYGGFNTNVTNIDLADRDLINDETVFHATGNGITLTIGDLPYYNNAITPDFCIIDGITLTSDNLLVGYNALFIVDVNCLVSQFKIENYLTSDKLVFIEGPLRTTTFVNSLFTDNEANNLIGLCSNANFINVTIAGNDFKEEMFLPYLHEHIDNMQNCIVYDNTNMDMDWTHNISSFSVFHSILETLENWVIDNNGNLFNTDPIFTFHTPIPYSCDYSSSPARMSGEPYFITSLETNPLLLLTPPPATIIGIPIDTAIIYYDVVNMYRFGNYDHTAIDIGAHQNGDDYNSYFRISNPLRNTINHNTNEDKKQESITLVLYNAAGQMVYSGVLNDGINSLTALLNAGTYIARTSSFEGNEKYTKLIISK